MAKLSHFNVNNLVTLQPPLFAFGKNLKLQKAISCRLDSFVRKCFLLKQVGGGCLLPEWKERTEAFWSAEFVHRQKVDFLLIFSIQRVP